MEEVEGQWRLPGERLSLYGLCTEQCLYDYEQRMEEENQEIYTPYLTYLQKITQDHEITITARGIGDSLCSIHRYQAFLFQVNSQWDFKHHAYLCSGPT